MRTACPPTSHPSFGWICLMTGVGTRDSRRRVRGRFLSFDTSASENDLPPSIGSKRRVRRPCFELLCTNIFSETAKIGGSTLTVVERTTFNNGNVRSFSKTNERESVTWNRRISRGLPAFFKQFWLHLRKNFRKNLEEKKQIVISSLESGLLSPIRNGDEETVEKDEEEEEKLISAGRLVSPEGKTGVYCHSQLVRTKQRTDGMSWTVHIRSFSIALFSYKGHEKSMHLIMVKVISYRYWWGEGGGGHSVLRLESKRDARRDLIRLAMFVFLPFDNNRIRWCFIAITTGFLVTTTTAHHFMSQ